MRPEIGESTFVYCMLTFAVATAASAAFWLATADLSAA